MKVRKKPVEVEAIQWNRDSDIGTMTFVWPEFTEWRTEGDTLQILTLEGVMTVRLGDWIIKGVNGEFYPCKPDIFIKTYDPL